MNHQLAGSAASIASSLPFKPSPPPLTFHNPTKQLLLAQLRELRMADTIIFSLIERAQVLHTDSIHASGIQRPFVNAQPLPTYAVLHQAHPRLCAALHVARELAFFSRRLPEHHYPTRCTKPAPIKPTRYTRTPPRTCCLHSQRQGPIRPTSSPIRQDSNSRSPASIFI